KSIKKSLNYHLSENLEFNVDDLQEDDAFILVNTPQQMKDEIISTAKSYHLAECFAHFLAYQTAKSRLSNSPIIEINMQGNQPLKFAWNFFNCHQLSGALKATVFIPTQDTQHDSAYVAWTGTMDLPTLLADMQCNPGETDYDQAKEIISENILECLKIAHKRKLKLEFVGHSLGGSFAQYSTNTALTLCLKYDLPVAIKMTVFNSPGVSKTAYKESIALAHELSARGFPAIEACFVVKDKDIVQRAGFCKLFQGINPELVNISMAKINPTLPSNLIAAHRFKLNSYALTINPNTESTAIVTIDPQANFYIGIRCNDDEKTKICLAESLRKHSAVLRWLTSVASFPAVIGRFFITAHHPSRLLQKPLALSTDDSHEDGFCRVEQSVLPQTPLFFSSIRGSGGICSANPTP
ncbi:hypothetical protein EBS02_07205, partial [bacterium]|nr:hypothetical protein [bacterium]